MRRHALALALVALVASPALAQSPAGLAASCPLAKGDPVAKVRKIYGLTAAPEALNRTVPGGAAFQYRLQQYGIWVYLDDKLTVSTLRFEAPFRGKIDGIGIGDDVDTLRLAKGEPARRGPGLPDPVATERRNARAKEILDALPDPVPKAKVIETYAEISRLLAAPSENMTGWLYNPGKPNAVRYDVSSRDSKVHAMVVATCAPES